MQAYNGEPVSHVSIPDGTGAVDYVHHLFGRANYPDSISVLAYHQFGPYEMLLIPHILFSEILLIMIPFTKLGHMILFFFTRAFIGFEMGGRRDARSW